MGEREENKQQRGRSGRGQGGPLTVACFTTDQPARLQSKFVAFGSVRAPHTALADSHSHPARLRTRPAAKRSSYIAYNTSTAHPDDTAASSQHFTLFWALLLLVTALHASPEPDSLISELRNRHLGTRLRLQNFDHKKTSSLSSSHTNKLLHLNFNHGASSTPLCTHHTLPAS